jgi:hypothetical protein
VGKAVNEKIEIRLVLKGGTALNPYLSSIKMIQALGEFLLMGLFLIGVPLGLFVGALLVSVVFILLLSIPILLCHWTYELFKAGLT